jgi:hypothetical protein
MMNTNLATPAAVPATPLNPSNAAVKAIMTRATAMYNIVYAHALSDILNEERSLKFRPRGGSAALAMMEAQHAGFFNPGQG